MGGTAPEVAGPAQVPVVWMSIIARAGREFYAIREVVGRSETKIIIWSGPVLRCIIISAGCAGCSERSFGNILTES